MSGRNLQNRTPEMHSNLALRSWLDQLESRRHTTNNNDTPDSAHRGPRRDQEGNVGGGSYGRF